jgi:hypothetical protein
MVAPPPFPPRNRGPVAIREVPCLATPTNPCPADCGTNEWFHEYKFSNQISADDAAVQNCNAYFHSTTCAVIVNYNSAPDSRCFQLYVDRANDCWGAGVGSDNVTAAALAFFTCAHQKPTCTACGVSDAGCF